jgi:hypothetical protein
VVEEANASASRPADIALITYSADRDMLAVSSGLSAAGIPNRLWFFDGKDEDMTVEAKAGRFSVRNRGRVLTMEDLCRARVVVHRTGLGHWTRPVTSSSTDHADRAFEEREWASLFHGLLHEVEQRCPDLTWINRPSVSGVASEKYQLLATADLDDLVVPQFCVSTQSSLPHSASGHFVCKALSEDESIDGSTTYCTALLDAETRSAVPFRTDCPSLIQERVLVHHELRVYHLLGETLGMRITADRPDYADIRLVPREGLSVELVDVGPNLQRRVQRYCERRGMAYCVFDFLHTSGDRDLLVDVTPCGTWSHFESSTDRPVTRWYVSTLCRFLGERSADRLVGAAAGCDQASS